MTGAAGSLGAVPAALALIAVAGTDSPAPEHQPNYWVPVVLGILPLAICIVLVVREDR